MFKYPQTKNFQNYISNDLKKYIRENNINIYNKFYLYNCKKMNNEKEVENNHSLFKKNDDYFFFDEDSNTINNLFVKDNSKKIRPLEFKNIFNYNEKINDHNYNNIEKFNNEISKCKLTILYFFTSSSFVIFFCFLSLRYYFLNIKRN